MARWFHIGIVSLCFVYGAFAQSWVVQVLSVLAGLSWATVAAYSWTPR
jgi:hypothetical protein